MSAHRVSPFIPHAAVIQVPKNIYISTTCSGLCDGDGRGGRVAGDRRHAGIRRRVAPETAANQTQLAVFRLPQVQTSFFHKILKDMQLPVPRGDRARGVQELRKIEDGAKIAIRHISASNSGEQSRIAPHQG